MKPPPQFRRLRFESIGEALAEAGRLVASERAGRLARCGNWPLGRMLGHLATWASFAFDGYPPALRASLVVRLVLRLIRKRALSGPMPLGFRIRGFPEGTAGLGPLPTEEGHRRFQAAMTRLRDNAPTIRNPIFGRLTHDQWIQLNLRHAELHSTTRPAAER